MVGPQMFLLQLLKFLFPEKQDLATWEDPSSCGCALTDLLCDFENVLWGLVLEKMMTAYKDTNTIISKHKL